MAAKTSTAAVAAIVAAVTFALGLGGGLAIQAARNEEPPKALTALEVRRNPQERLMVSNLTRTPIPASAPMPGDASAEDAEARLGLAEEIWAQFKRPRFWKDREAQDDTLPKLKRLRPDLTGFFIERYREPELTQEQKASAIHLAMMCGGQSAADLLFELIQVPYSEETKKLRWASIAALSAVRDDYTPAPKDFPVSASLWSSAMTLLTSKGGWDRVLAVSVLSLGKRDEWMPVLSNTARTDSSGLVRSETIYLLSLRGDASALAFLRDQRGAITDVPPESNPPVERHRQMLERIIDEAIEKLERRLKN